MENHKWIIITIVAYFLALLWDLKNRDKEGRNSPKKFNIMFYLQDNLSRIIVSLLFSAGAAYLFWEVSPELFEADAQLSKWGIAVYVAIGAAPDLVVSYAKRKTSFLRPNEVITAEETFKRKQT